MPRNAKVWLLMVSAVGIHVIDEALTGFLPFYNAQVLALRDRQREPADPDWEREDRRRKEPEPCTIGFALTRVVARGGNVIRCRISDLLAAIGSLLWVA